jgi:GntR family negative regulator for fad regulon and positive regulator of fabA
MNWMTPLKPADLAETRLIDAILEGHFQIGTTLTAERELAAQLGVTRPTLREALQRLGRDGWVEIHQGRPTRVRDYWQEGNLGVLGAIARHSDHLPPHFVANLLHIRLLLAPAYASLAVQNAPDAVIRALHGHTQLPDNPQAFAAFDWQLHHCLTIASQNPVFTLILNGFKDLYYPMACLYFQPPESRDSSRAFYARLHEAAVDRDAQQVEAITRSVMGESLLLWQAAAQNV